MATYIKDIQLHSVYSQLFQVTNSVYQISLALHGISTVWVIWVYGQLTDQEQTKFNYNKAKQLASDDSNYDSYDIVPSSPVSEHIPSETDSKTPLITKHPQRTSRRKKCVLHTITQKDKKRISDTKNKKKPEQENIEDHLQSKEEPKKTVNDSIVSANDQNGFFQCGHCKDVFTAASLLKYHIKKENHDTHNNYPCGNCGQVFSSLLSLSRHIRIHSAKAPQFDSDDDKQNTFVAENETLDGSKKKKRTYCCRQCRKLFSTLKKLATHRLIVHGKNVNFNCEQCSATFMYKNQLTEHLRTHSGEKPFPCSICGMRFARQSYVAIHQRVHTGEKKYCCKECGKAYAHRNPLIAHERTHVGDAPFICSLCPKSYTSKTSLSLHEKTRHKQTEETYQCTLCGKLFSDKRNLRRHETYHYGTRPFPCTLCQNSFLFKKDLNDHMNIHTGEKPYLA